MADEHLIARAEAVNGLRHLFVDPGDDGYLVVRPEAGRLVEQRAETIAVGAVKVEHLRFAEREPRKLRIQIGDAGALAIRTEHPEVVRVSRVLDRRDHAAGCGREPPIRFLP
ncbi:MAG: hypothetical protein ACRD2A_19890, partial [Vicinamibacterales bacterium]